MSTADSTWDLDGTNTPSPDLFQEVEGAVLARRYRLISPLGRGGQGRVWVAWDLAREREVAVKLVSAAGDVLSSSARREVTALRQADLPGVVPLLDDGVEAGTWFVVMPVLPGRPFPGRPGPVGWSELRGVALRLLEILSSVHHAGLIHRDLKASNVLVQGDEVMVLDLGLAHAVDAAATGRIAGSPATIAPEVLRQEPVGLAADLYAIGAMLYRSLSGEVPHGPADLASLARRRSSERPRPLADHGVDAPPEVIEVVELLLDPDPRGRPASALEVIGLLGGSLPGPFGHLVLPPPGHNGRLEERQLQGLFHGPDAFMHLREDGAAELWRRTGGEPELVRRELAGWLRAGIGRWEAGRMRLSRDELTRLGRLAPLALRPLPEGLSEEETSILGLVALAWPGILEPTLRGAVDLPPLILERGIASLEARGLLWRDADQRLVTSAPVPHESAQAVQRLRQAVDPSHPCRLGLLLRSELDDAAVIEAILASLPEVRARGGPARTWPLVEAGVRHARAQGLHRAELDLCAAATELALFQELAPQLEAALFLVGGCRSPSPDLPTLEALLRAGRASLQGEHARVEVLLGDLAELPWEDLEIWRQILLLEAARARGLESEAALLQSLEAWSRQGSPRRRARLLGWRGTLAYKRGDFEGAARLHLESRDGRRTHTGKLAATLNAASALVETFAYAAAAELLEECRRDARRRRLPRYELHAHRLLRNLHYRMARAEQPETHLLGAARLVHPWIAASLVLTEAAIAWRGGHPDARELAERAVEDAATALDRAPGSVARRAASLWARGLRLVLDPSCGEDADLLLAQAGDLGAPVLEAQVIGLVGMARGPAGLAGSALRCLSHWRAPDPSMRMDVLSEAEIRRSCGLEPAMVAGGFITQV